MSFEVLEPCFLRASVSMVIDSAQCCGTVSVQATDEEEKGKRKVGKSGREKESGIQKFQNATVVWPLKGVRWSTRPNIRSSHEESSS